jgi:geranylgeranyl pyrophosphate synthase
MAFQLIDDLLDYLSTSSRMGKPVFSDLKEGKLTLPAISLLEKAPDEVRPIIEKIWETDDAVRQDNDIEALLELMNHHGTLEEARELAHSASRAAIETLPNIEWENADQTIAGLLKDIPEILVGRAY